MIPSQPWPRRELNHAEREPVAHSPLLLHNDVTPTLIAAAEDLLNADLRKQLESLHSELNLAAPVDAESRALLVTLLGDITRLLSQSPPQGAVTEHGLTEKLDQLAVQFQAEHPALGTAIRALVDTLGKAGI